MKRIFTLIAEKGILLFLSVFMLISQGYAQAPKFRFHNPVLESGVNLKLGAVYRFSNVNLSGPSVDALVTIKDVNGSIQLKDIDRTADGYDEAFQPEYQLPSQKSGYIDFDIVFVVSGTSSAISQPSVDVTGLDIDGSTKSGNTLKEFNRIDLGGGICTFDLVGGELSIAHVGTGYEAQNVTGTLFGALVDTSALSVMFTVTKANVTNFSFRIGANSAVTGTNTRYASFYFKAFEYPNVGLLPLSSIQGFRATRNASGNNEINWSLDNNNNIDEIMLEKSFDGKNFSDLAVYLVGGDKTAPGLAYKYNDGETNGAVQYYRLKITGMNGKSEYGNVVKIQSATTQTGQSMQVFPTIIRQTATVNFTSVTKQKANIYITDMQGRMVKQIPAMLEKGPNSLSVSGFDQMVSGNYFVTLVTPEQKQSIQIVHQ